MNIFSALIARQSDRLALSVLKMADASFKAYSGPGYTHMHGGGLLVPADYRSRFKGRNRRRLALIWKLVRKTLSAQDRLLRPSWSRHPLAATPAACPETGPELVKTHRASAMCRAAPRPMHPFVKNWQLCGVMAPRWMLPLPRRRQNAATFTCSEPSSAVPRPSPGYYRAARMSPRSARAARTSARVAWSSAFATVPGANRAGAQQQLGQMSSTHRRTGEMPSELSNHSGT